jgi:hypothetical protein
MLWHAASLYHQMLSSWVGEVSEPLVALPSDSVSNRAPIPLTLRAAYHS